ncbi:PH domain-containing protein [Candidatus Parcubacteria bacterium]|nr:PH domain-containing protein [Candidatus Parcubacteria bacterium]
MFNKDKLPNQLDDEKTILILRRHWFIFFKSILLFAFLAITPVIFLTIINNFIIGILEHYFFAPFILLLFSAYYLGIWLFLFANFIDYHLDVWIVTNVRILNIEQKGLFSRVISEQKIEKIQDITSEVHGIIPTFLDYGDVHIQTAGTQQRFIFRKVPHPADTRKKILILVKETKRFKKILKGEDKIKI